MNRYQFEVLTYIEKNGKKEYPMRTLSDTLKISGTAISKALDELENEALIKRCEDQMEITERGLEALEPYRVKRAVIMAAGFGSRMVLRKKNLMRFWRSIHLSILLITIYMIKPIIYHQQWQH